MEMETSSITVGRNKSIWSLNYCTCIHLMFFFTHSTTPERSFLSTRHSSRGPLAGTWLCIGPIHPLLWASPICICRGRRRNRFWNLLVPEQRTNHCQSCPSVASEYRQRNLLCCMHRLLEIHQVTSQRRDIKRDREQILKLFSRFLL